MPHRRALMLSIGLCAAAAAPLAAGQAAYPSRPVELTVGFSPGGSVDLMARGLAEEMSQKLGQPVIVRNIAGASGTVAMRLMLNKPADGYSMVFGPATTLISALHTGKPGYTLADFTPVCQVFRNNITLAVPATSPYRTLDDLLAAAKRSPDALSYGHTGRGSVIHITIANLMAQKGTSAVDIPYRGESAMLPALLSGDIAFGAVSSVTAATQGAKLRVLAALDDERDPLRPDTPSMRDAGSSSVPPVGLNGLYLRAGTPTPVRQAIEQACREASASPHYQALATRFATRLEFQSGDAFQRRIEADWRRIGELVKELPLGDLSGG
ncbi:MAG: tripartite tricarboxylate transporter substrate binding protein [Xenophilus sp.]